MQQFILSEVVDARVEDYLGMELLHHKCSDLLAPLQGVDQLVQSHIR